MAVRLLRCSGQWVKIGTHPCWKVEKALIDMGIGYETVAGPAMPWQREPRPVGCMKLAGRDDYRIRVGDHHVVYAVDDSARVVLVARVAHRREVYRR